MKTLQRHLLSSAVAGALTLTGTAALAAQDDIATLRADIETLKQQVKSAAEWKRPNSLIHMAGYADVDYVDPDNGPGSFASGSISPIFHYQYRDLVMVESEFEITTNELGENEFELEYLTVDLFLSDSAVLVAGKFLSPLGQFRQNLHPSWINRAPSAPAGFGHDEAAPNAEVGLQVRGGFPVGSDGIKANYAVYIGNGPVVEAAGGALEKVETPGIGADDDGNKVSGGRFGLLFPVQKLDIGLSYATGQTAVRDLGPPVTYEAGRDYEYTGFDFTWRPAPFDLRGEYAKQEVGGLPGSAYAVNGAVWEAWYVQGAYRFGDGKWEVVLRLSEYDAPDDATDNEQTLVGLNYLFASNLIGKIAIERNDNPNAGLQNDDRTLVQLAYGF